MCVMRLQTPLFLAVALAMPMAASAAPPDPASFLFGSYSSPANYENHRGEFADRDGDGDPDYVSGSYWGYISYVNTATDYTHNGNGGWGGQYNNETQWADFNGEGPPELLWRAVGGLHVASWSGAAVSTAGVTYTDYPETGDFNGDGFADIFTLSNGQNAEVWLAQALGPGEPVTFTQGWVDASTTSITARPHAKDYDGDGDLDIVVGSNNGPMSVFQNDGAGNFFRIWQTTDNHDVRWVRFGDIDGDGALDIVGQDWTASAPHYMAWWKNNGDDTWTLIGDIPTTATNTGFDVGDWDGDGDDELAFSPGTTTPTVVWDWDGSGWVVAWQGDAFAGNKETYNVRFHDYEGDGVQELFEVNRWGIRIYGWDDDDDFVPNYLDVCPGGDDVVDTDSDTVPDDCDVCPGTDDRPDVDYDGVPNCLDECPEWDDSVDSDGDGVPDGCDVCDGDDSIGDDDGDRVCNDADICPGSHDLLDLDGDGIPNGCDFCPGDDSIDADGDGIGDECDVCFGDDLFGDTDVDLVCDDLDMCVGDDSSGDSDLDFICDDRDTCDGDDLIGDSDGDGVCDDNDVCLGDDASLDSDGDLVCDNLDQCAGDDASGDVDGDGVCEDVDVCLGDDLTGDLDGDGICDPLDVCAGDNSSGDLDGDGVCEDIDVCTGDDATGDTDADSVCDDRDLCDGDDGLGDADGDGTCDGAVTDICIGDDATGDTDGDGICDSDEVMVVRGDGAYVTAQGEALVIADVDGVLANDSGVNTITVDTEAAQGVIELADNGGFTYTPAAGFSGGDAFAYEASNGITTDVAWVLLEVTADAEAPVAVPDVHIWEDSDTVYEVAADLGVLLNDHEPADLPLSAVLDEDAAFGELTLNDDGSFSYMASFEFDGEDSFTYIASSDNGDSLPATVLLMGPTRVPEDTALDPVNPNELPPGFDDDQGCLCNGGAPPHGGALVLLGLLLSVRRRS